MSFTSIEMPIRDVTLEELLKAAREARVLVYEEIEGRYTTSRVRYVSEAPAAPAP